MEFSKVITYFGISAVMLTLPELLQVTSETMGTVGPTALETVAKPGNLAQVTNNFSSQMSQITGIISALSYMIGIMFGIRGALALKEYNETAGGTIHHSEVSKPAPPPAAKFNLNKEVKIEKTETVKDMFKKEKLYDYDFEDKELNELGVQIQTKVKYLRNHNFLQKDMESLLMVENIEKEYLNSIHQSYIEVPFAKRGNKKMDKSPYSLTHSQLNLILASLDEIENKIVDHNVMHQRANEIFLKEKLANM